MDYDTYENFYYDNDYNFYYSFYDYYNYVIDRYDLKNEDDD